MARLKFGTFIAPVHKPGINPTLAFEQDLQLVEHLDRLGYDEAWFGEHHSAGSELIGSPEIFIAAAAARTRQIKLGTGVTSIAYHNPLWVADRMVQLDHMTRGRVMLGVGPGSLPTDSAMIGLTPTQTREILEPNLDVILRLLAGETVTTQTITHNLIDAKLQLAPYSDPLFDITVAAVASPTGARLAGKYGKRLSGFAPEALKALTTAAWPGNVRQLYNVVEQVCALATSPLIPLSLVQRALRIRGNEVLSYAEAKLCFERDYIVQLLKLTDGNVSDAARIADRNRTEFYHLLQKHALTPTMFRGAARDSGTLERCRACGAKPARRRPRRPVPPTADRDRGAGCPRASGCGTGG